MKRNLLVAAAALTLAACTTEQVAQVPPPVDPCQPVTYNAPLCQQAVAARGYFWYGTFYPVMYPYPFGFYSNRSLVYVRGGGRVTVIRSGGAYSRTYVRSGAVRSGGGFTGGRSSVGTSSGTARGGFGSTGAGRSGGFGGGFGG